MKTFTRDIPEHYQQFTPEIGDYPKDLFAVYIYPERFIAKFFFGKQSKAAWHIRFRNLEDMKKRVNESISNAMRNYEDKITRREKRKIELVDFYKDLKVGDLFCYSWGYDQTNVDFYQLVAFKGKTMTFKAIASKTVPSSGGDYNGMADRRTAVKDAFLDEERYEPLIKRSLSMDFGMLSKTTESEPHYCSWYA